MSRLDLHVPEGPAAEFQHRVSELVGEHPARDALVRTAAELSARLAPGWLGNSQCTGEVSLDYPETLEAPNTCRASISVEIAYPEPPPEPDISAVKREQRLAKARAILAEAGEL